MLFERDTTGVSRRHVTIAATCPSSRELLCRQLRQALCATYAYVPEPAYTGQWLAFFGAEPQNLRGQQARNPSEQRSYARLGGQQYTSQEVHAP